jgi:hypothetical protein
LIACKRPKEVWHFEIFDRSEKTKACWLIIESLDHECLGFLCHANKLWSPTLYLWAYELKPGASYLEVTPSLLRYLDEAGMKLAKKQEHVDFRGYTLELGEEHPAYEALPGRMPLRNPPYAWYLRLPDLVDFLAHIKPVLEKRLVESAAVGYSGGLKLNFYRAGVVIQFEKGKIKCVESYQPESHRDGDVLFPNQTFLQVLVGYKTLAELSSLLPDCQARNDQGRALVNFLFPKKVSHVWPI